LQGVLLVAPELLRRLDALVDRLDKLMASLSEDAFVALLPHLRRAFTALDPRETTALAADIAARHGAGPQALHAAMPQGATEAELHDNLADARQIVRLLEQDGLAHWLSA
jgi:hypothetical protein